MITDLLDQIDRLDQDATKGPWEFDDEENEMIRVISETSAFTVFDDIGIRVDDHVDAAFIALARTALPAMSKALRAVLWLHRPVEDRIHHGGMVCSHLRCTDEYHHDQSAYPCDTVRALTDAMEGDDE